MSEQTSDFVNGVRVVIETRGVLPAFVPIHIRAKGAPSRLYRPGGFDYADTMEIDADSPMLRTCELCGTAMRDQPKCLMLWGGPSPRQFCWPCAYPPGETGGVT